MFMKREYTTLYMGSVFYCVKIFHPNSLEYSVLKMDSKIQTLETPQSWAINRKLIIIAKSIL